MNMMWQQRRQDEPNNRPQDHRSPWQRDKARILHSAAFRRLQAKTQIMGVGQNDFYRTRLTHSLEAAQIGSALTAQLRIRSQDPVFAALLPDDSLIEALCLAHDIGHPPFGHGGETALNQCMAPFGGFEGNGQTLRIVGKLEPYTAEGGMNLARRTLLGLLKYPILQPDFLAPVLKINAIERDTATASASPRLKPCKAIYQIDADLLDWILAPLSAQDRQLFQSTDELPQGAGIKARYKSLDASIMELADDIAYGVHDLEDAIVTGTVNFSQWHHFIQNQQAELSKASWEFLHQIGDYLFRSEHYLRKEAIGALVNRLITSVQWDDVLPTATEPFIRFNATLPPAEHQILQLLKSFIFQSVILKPELQQLEYRGQFIVKQLFNAFHAEPLRLLPENTRRRYQQLEAQQQGARAVCDYLAGMTDEYAERMYQRLFGKMS